MRVWGLTRRRLHRARRQVGDPDRGDRREALLDRREHVGPRHRVRCAREPVVLAARRAVHAHAARRRTRRVNRATSSSASTRACRSASTARRSGLVELIDTLGTAVGGYGWGRIDMVENRRVGIKSREVYECPASLALIAAHQDLEGITLERDVAAREAAGRDPCRRVDLRRHVARAADARARSVRARDAARRDRRGSVAARTRPLLRGRSPGAARSVRPRPRDVRRRGLVPPPGFRRVRAALGAVGRDVVAPARVPGRTGERPDRERTAAVARPFR